MANIERLKQVLQIIKDNPKHWNQSEWHCNTSHCFAGFGDCLAAGVDFKQKVSGNNPDYRIVFSISKPGSSVYDVAMEWFELDDIEANILFNSENDLETLEMIIDKIERDEL